MARSTSVSETPATQWLRARHVAFTEHRYNWQAHGGSMGAARQLGLDEHEVVKTLVLQDQNGAPLLVLMHGDCKVSGKNLARQIGAKSVQPCTPEVAQRHSGYWVGGISPFATRRAMPVFMEESILQLPRIAINGGLRGLLLQLEPHICQQLLGAKKVQCAQGKR